MINPKDTVVSLFDIKPHESILILFDSTTKAFVDSLNIGKATFINIDTFNRPLESVPYAILDRLPVDVCMCFIDKKSDEDTDELAFRKSLVSKVEEFGRIGTLLGATPQIIESAFRASAQECEQTTTRVYDWLKQVKEVTISTPAGTQLSISFTEKYNWVPATGKIERGKTRNAMPSEVYTYPQSVTGKLVIDGTYSWLLKYKKPDEICEFLKQNPITFEIKNSKIESAFCNDAFVLGKLNEMLQSHEYANHIGEVGFGTNIGIKELLGNVMHDEKFPGVHIANGDGYQKSTGCEYTCPLHYDGILLNPTVTDETGRILLKDGKFV
jgi:aminopeptidase